MEDYEILLSGIIARKTGAIECSLMNFIFMTFDFLQKQVDISCKLA